MSEVITQTIQDNGDKVTIYKPQAFENQGVVNDTVPNSESQTITDIGQLVRSLLGDDTPDMDSIEVKRINLHNDRPIYNMELRFSGQFPIVVSQEIGDMWKLHDMRHCEDHTIAVLRHKETF